jgi:hypothetical protein
MGRKFFPSKIQNQTKMKLSLSGYSIPDLVSPQFLFSLIGQDYNKSNLDVSVSLQDIKDHLDGEFCSEDADLKTVRACELYIDAFSKNEDDVINETIKANLEKCIGRIVRYKNRQGVLITSFVSGMISFNEDKGLYFKHGKDDDAYESALEFVPGNPRKPEIGTWAIENTSFISQTFVTIETENQGKKSYTAYLSCKVEDSETEENHEFLIRFNVGLNDPDREKSKQLRKDDPGNKRAIALLDKKIIKSATDFSTCVLPEYTGRAGMKSDIKFLLDGYLDKKKGGKFNQVVFKIIELTHRKVQKKDESGDFDEFTVRFDTAMFPVGLKLTVFDFAADSTQKIDAESLGYVQLPANRLVSAWSKVEAGKISLPSEETPWILDINVTGKITRTNPYMTVWANSLDLCPQDVQDIFEASQSIGFWGGIDYATINELQDTVVPQEVDLSDIEEDEEDSSGFLQESEDIEE